MLDTVDAADHSRRAGHLNYEIELLELTPAHVGTIRQSDYRLTLQVRAK